MEIVIENPEEIVATGTAPHRRPTYRTYRGGIDTPSLEYFANVQPIHHRAFVDQVDVDGQHSVRRVDRSGLLEISEAEPRWCRPWHLSGAQSVLNDRHVGTLRRVDRSGLLEAVPEVPDQVQSHHRCPDDRGRSIGERLLTGAEIDEEERLSSRAIDSDLGSRLVGARSPIGSTYPTTYGPSDDQLVGGVERPLRGIADEPQVPAPSTNSVQFEERRMNCSPRSTARMSPVVGRCTVDDWSRSVDRFDSVSCAKYGAAVVEPESNRMRQSHLSTEVNVSRRRTDSPDELDPKSRGSSPLTVLQSRPYSASPSIDTSRLTEIEEFREQSDSGSAGPSPKSRTNGHAPMKTLSIPDLIEAHGTLAIRPEGERAEAEGCEHTAVESVEEARVSFKAPNKLLPHSENIQTLRVIILSEQL